MATDQEPEHPSPIQPFAHPFQSISSPTDAPSHPATQRHTAPTQQPTHLAPQAVPGLEDADGVPLAGGRRCLACRHALLCIDPVRPLDKLCCSGTADALATTASHGTQSVMYCIVLFDVDVDVDVDIDVDDVDVDVDIDVDDVVVDVVVMAAIRNMGEGNVKCGQQGR